MVKSSPELSGEPFDQFLQLLWAFIRTTTLHLCFTFNAICFTGYGVIAGKPRIGHLPRIGFSYAQ